jgi:hypothetical protein
LKFPAFVPVHPLLPMAIFFKLGFLLSYKSDQNSKLSSVDNVPSHHGLKGGMLPVASVAERLLKLGGCAPDCVLARPALGGL